MFDKEYMIDLFKNDNIEKVQAKIILSDALTNSPSFTTNLAINNKNKLSILWLVYLSTLENKFLFTNSFDKIITTFDDLYLFIEYCRKKNIRKGMGRCVKRIVNTWIHDNLSSKDFNKNELREILNITHPKFPEDTQFQNILKGRCFNE